MRIRSGSVFSRLQCGRDQCALMRIECAFSAQCGQASCMSTVYFGADIGMQASLR